MNYVLAVLVPCTIFFKRGKVSSGITCLIIQLMVIGWIPAIIWSVTEVKIDENEKRFQKMRDDLSQL